MAAAVPPVRPIRRRVRGRVHALILNPVDIQSVSEASQRLLHHLNQYFSPKVRRGQNFVYSPLGAHLCLSLLRSGSTDQTSLDLTRCAKYVGASKEDMESGYHKIMQGFTEDFMIIFAPRSTLKPTVNFINRLYIPTRFNNINALFVQHVRHTYGMEVFIDDLRNDETIQRINGECRQLTDGKITSVLKTREFRADMYGAHKTGMVMLNVLYFKGLWEGHNAFNITDTKTMEFLTVTGDRVQVPMMRRKKMYGSFANFMRLECSIAALYFEGGRYCLLLYLPRSLAANAIKSLETKMHLLTMNTAAESFVRYHRRARRGDGGLVLNVTLPKFSASMDVSLHNTFKVSGAVKAFHPLTAQFGGIHPVLPNSDRMDQLHFTECVQKIVVDIDETSAPTNMNFPVYPHPRSQADCRVKTKKFCCNRPFMFSIFDYINNVNIAQGSVYNPLDTNAIQTVRT